MSAQALYQFARASIRKNHKLDGLKQQKIYCVTVLETGNPKSRCQWDWFLLRAVKAKSVPNLSPGSLLAIFNVPWLLYLCLSLHMTFLCVCIYVHILLFQKDTSHTGLGVHLTPVS